MKKQKEEAERYTQIQQNLKEQQQRRSMLKLYTIEQEVSKLQAKLSDCDEEVDLAANRHDSAENAVKAAEKENAKLEKCDATAPLSPPQPATFHPAVA